MASGITDKQIKAAAKEGAKKGQDIEGLQATGGVSFFHLALENAEGEVQLVKATMDAANAEVDEKAEDRKGGAGGIAKMLLSAGDKQVVIMVHVPTALQDKVKPKEWLDRVTAAMTDDIEIVEETPEIITAIAKGNPAKEKYPLKMRDAGINAGFVMLHEKQLVPEDDDDDEYVNYAEAAGVEW